MVTARRKQSKSDLARAQLKPLAPGERPAIVAVAAFAALALALASTVPYILGARPLHSNWYQAVPLAVLLLVAAIGIWRLRYWAVLGFEAYLALQIVVAVIALTVSNGLAQALVSILLVVVSSTLFWLLVKVMARIQLTSQIDSRTHI